MVHWSFHKQIRNAVDMNEFDRMSQEKRHSKISPPNVVSHAARPLWLLRLSQHLLPSLANSFFYAGWVLVGALALALATFLGILLLLRTVDPPTSAVMFAARLGGEHIQHHWVPIERISANLVRAVISSEDVRFCTHDGIDRKELEAAVRRAQREGIEAARGASTITMQVAKNLFLSHERTLVRKGLEIAAATAIDLVWSKRRTMEIYLNIAQWGEGVYGAEAAAKHFFGRSAEQLSEEEAALLAVSLPSPVTRSARQPSKLMRRLAQRIMTRKDHVPGAHMCIYPVRS